MGRSQLGLMNWRNWVQMSTLLSVRRRLEMLKLERAGIPLEGSMWRLP